MRRIPPETPIKSTDLRAITRHSQECLTVISVFHEAWDQGSRIEWIFCGQSRLRQNDRPDGRWTLEAYLLEGVTDFEHDSAYAFRIPLIGAMFKGIDYGVTRVEAWIDPNEEDRDYRIPLPGYNPMEHPKSFTCTQYDACKKSPHIIIPENFYSGPTTSPEIVAYLKGKKIEIGVSPVFPKSDQ